MPVFNVADYKRFLASAVETEREIRTIEIYHPSFSQPSRFVQDWVSLSYTLEATAPRNASQLVPFLAIAMRIQEPSETTDAEQNLVINLGGVGSDVKSKIENAFSGTGYLTPVEVIYRKYYSGDTSQPAMPPVYLYANDIVFENNTSVAITASDDDLQNKRCGQLYTLERFPSLKVNQ